MWSADLSASPYSRALFAIRGGHFSRPASVAPLTLHAMMRVGFTLLAQRPGEDLVIGLIGKPWQPAYEVRSFSASEFVPFDEPGYAKVAWDFQTGPEGARTRLSTRTRVLCTDRSSLWRFRLYWIFTGPFSGFIRREMLRVIKGCSEIKRAGVT